MEKLVPKVRKPMTVRHITVEGGQPVVKEETFGQKLTRIEHSTIVKGEQTTIVREDHTEREESHPEDPLGLRPDRRQLRR